MSGGFTVDFDLSKVATPARAGRVFDRAVEEILDYQAGYAQDSVREIVQAYAKSRTGAYERGVRIDRSAGTRRVHDRNMVYGPWLEGESPRNKATRYKGMHMWRLTRQDMESSQEIQRRNDEIMARNLREIS
jgi:hypothetical protein